MKKKCCLCFPQDLVTWAGAMSLESGWLGSQGRSILGLRELRACGRQCASKMNLECLWPSRYRRDNLLDWS